MIMISLRYLAPHHTRASDGDTLTIQSHCASVTFDLEANVIDFLKINVVYFSTQQVRCYIPEHTCVDETNILKFCQQECLTIRSKRPLLKVLKKKLFCQQVNKADIKRDNSKEHLV